MMKKIAFVFAFALLWMSCQTKFDSDFIIPFDANKFDQENFKNNALLKNTAHIKNKLFTEIEQKTLGKKLPSIMVKTADGQTMNLQKLIHQKTVLMMCNASCNDGLENMLNEMPKALEKLNINEDQLKIIALFIQNKNEDITSENIRSIIAQLQEKYTDFYIINDYEALKMNVIGNPTRMYIHDDLKVMDMSIGSLSEELICCEIVDFQKQTEPKTHISYRKAF